MSAETVVVHSHRPAEQTRTQATAMAEMATCSECGARIFQREFSIGGVYYRGDWVVSL